MFEVSRNTYLSILARASGTFRQRAIQAQDDHDKVVNEGRARQLEAVLNKTRASGESYNLVDHHVVNLLRISGIIYL